MILQSDDANLKAKDSETGLFDTSKVAQLVTATEEMEKRRTIIKQKGRKVAGSVSLHGKDGGSFVPEMSGFIRSGSPRVP